MGHTDKRKAKAIALRKSGNSLRDVERELGIPRSTLSGWFRTVPLTKTQQASLRARHHKALAHARIRAAKRHTELKSERNERVRKAILSEYSGLQRDDSSIETALAMLYLGEGVKTKNGLGLGNSDPMIMRFYVSAIRRLYGIPDGKLRVDLHLRADQDEAAMVRFWSKELGIVPSRFRYVIKDKRTLGKPTYPQYRGVCLVTGGGVEIQRRLLYLAEVLCSF